MISGAYPRDLLARYVTVVLEDCLDSKRSKVEPRWLVTTLNLLAMSINAVEKEFVSSACREVVSTALTDGVGQIISESEGSTEVGESQEGSPILRTLQVNASNRSLPMPCHGVSSGIELESPGL